MIGGFAFHLPASADPLHDSVPLRWLDPLLPEDLPKLDEPKYANDLDRAELQVSHGRFKQSLLTLYRVEHDPKLAAEHLRIALVRGEALAAIGQRDAALAALSVDDVKADPKAQILAARVIADLGRLPESLAMLRSLVATHPESVAGHYWLGMIAERAGDLGTAKPAYEWFIVEPQAFLGHWLDVQERAKGFETGESTILIGRAIDRWATLEGKYQDTPTLHDAMLNLFVRASDVIERGYWPAHVAAAEYYLSHDNSKQAMAELGAALKANPNDARASELVGQIALDQFNFAQCDSAIAALRKVDRQSTHADALEARNLLRQRDPAGAIRPIDRILAARPNDLEALGLLAACQCLQLKDDLATQTLARVDGIDQQNASAYFEVAEQLGAMRQYPRAAAMYLKAVERAPWWTEPRNGLGLLYTQSGDEEQALTTLNAAHTLDPYNLRTTNYLRLLDDLAKFARKESAHFVVMYDADQDPMIPEYFSDYLESIHAAVAGQFHHEPAVKTYIEVFPTHDAFSVRTTGSPWIGTVGASTGRVIALVAPRRGENTMGPFNWAQVLRHEYTHTVTLSATDNRIPHWMTEGLAVYEEHMPLRWEWVPMLYHAVTENELFPMDGLTWGFVRPKKPSDRQLAYAQSFWVCTYIEQKYGFDKILKMLDVVRTGTSEEQMFDKVLGVSRTEFSEDFIRWAHAQVAGWGYDEATSKKYAELRERGENLISGKQFVAAVKVWEEIASIRPVDALPHQRLYALYVTKEVNQPAKAIEQLQYLAAVEIKDNRYAKRIARLYRDVGNQPEAEKSGLEAVYIDPYDVTAHQLLEELYAADPSKAGEPLDRETRAIATLEQWKQQQRLRAGGGGTTPDAP